MKFDPTINTGHILTLVVIASSAFMVYTGVREDQVKQRAELEAVKATAATERTQTKETLNELKADIKELQKTTNDVKESLAILRGRAADTGAHK
jgi:septal ring factor EnvC (AmiA/AmiB activator)